MNRQKSFEDENRAALFLIPTPIGNLQEVSPRILKTLEEMDVIACEDTRNSGMLLSRLNISKPLISHHEHNTETAVPKILSLLEEGKKVGVISDAGYPVISDPGAWLAQQAIEHGYPVIPMSGPNAALNALVASGLDAKHYWYYGFLEAKSKKRKDQLQALKDLPYTMIFYEAPHRIEDMLEDVLKVLGNRRMCLAREITKLHEEFLRGTVQEILGACKGLKGEMVVVLEGAAKEESAGSIEDACQMVADLVAEGVKTKDACRQAAAATGFSKNELYNLYLSKKNQD